MLNNKSVLIAMSGGVDSAAAALLLKNAGYDCQGVIMRLIDTPETESAITDAKILAEKMGIPLHVLDLREDFRRRVIDNFISVYESGGTPNPCVECNRFLKFGALLDFCDRLGCDFLATGHYARIEYSPALDRHLLLRAADPKKDQSYFLWHLTESQLSRIIFPLGGYQKEEVRAIAEGAGLINARKKDSQDICFVPDGDYSKVICGLTGKCYPSGNFINPDGKILGRHKGMIHYTIGQRRGLGISASEHLYVLKKNVDSGDIVLAFKKDIMTNEMTAGGVNFISSAAPTGAFRASVKCRNTQPPRGATIEPLSNGSVRIIFDEPQTYTSPGQSLVMYDGDTVIGGGYLE